MGAATIGGRPLPLTPAEKPVEAPNTPSTPGRGWNDPPMLPPMNGMSPSTGAIKKTGINLNKRVAFPLSASGAGASKPVLNTAAPPLMPPMVMLPKLLEPENSTNENSASVEQNDTLDLQGTLSNFDKILSNTINFGGKATVQTELQNIKSMWEKEELNDDTCLSIQKFSEALLVKDTTRAQDLLCNISKSLMQRPDTVEWSSALRSLVNYFALASVYNEATTADLN